VAGDLAVGPAGRDEPQYLLFTGGECGRQRLAGRARGRSCPGRGTVVGDVGLDEPAGDTRLEQRVAVGHRAHRVDQRLWLDPLEQEPAGSRFERAEHVLV
jgi:hypothetical protein